MQIKNDGERAEKYLAIMEKLKRTLNTEGSDSRWYKRAFTDNGETLGSLQNEECKIDNISQAGQQSQKRVTMIKNI